MRPSWLAACLLLLASPGAAEIYRCGNSARFTNDPKRCPDAVVVRPRAGVVRAPAEPSPPAAEDPTSAARSLDELFVPDTSVAGTWEVVREAPQPPDPELRSRGLRESLARHYTRALGPVSEVCTVELWAFEDAAHARAAVHALDQKDWKILQSDGILILLHGVRLERKVGTRKGLVAGCAELGDRTRERVARSQGGELGG